jgi:diaminopimelate decarboxylase
MIDFEKHDWARLARHFETPFYLYDMDQAVAHTDRLRAALPGRVDLLYAAKANPNPRVLAELSDHVWGLDISSGGEIELAARVGYPLSRMSFAGPGKTDGELRGAIEGGIHVLSVESVSELRRAASIAEQSGARASIALRVNPLATAKAFAMRMGGLPSQFGVPEEEADAVLGEALSYASLDVRGIHIFSGTQCLDVAAIADNARQTLGIAKRLADAHDHTFSLVNLGGGFGIPYFAGHEAMDVDALAAAVGAAIEEFAAAEPRFGDTRFAIELGRYLIGMFGMYVARVVDVKENRGKRFVILDGGMNHVFPATGNFGQLVKKNYPVRNLSRLDDPQTVSQEIVGPLCTPMDSLARDLRLPSAEPGDLIGFLNCGAYSFSASPLLFLGHHTPLELVHRRGGVEVARHRHGAGEFA